MRMTVAGESSRWGKEVGCIEGTATTGTRAESLVEGCSAGHEGEVLFTVLGLVRGFGQEALCVHYLLAGWFYDYQMGLSSPLTCGLEKTVSEGGDCLLYAASKGKKEGRKKEDREERKSENWGREQGKYDCSARVGLCHSRYDG